ncbi:MAG: hypothetical protein U1E45_10745 [Geminicoccaceae bacterium]
MDEGRPLGRRFSHVYLERRTPTEDSNTARARIYYFIAHEFRSCDGVISVEIGKELGVIVYQWHGVKEFLQKCSPHEFLDALTIICRAIVRYKKEMSSFSEPQRVLAKLVGFCNRVFREENVGHFMDELGGVHYFVDVEFQRNRLSAIACLDRKSMASAKFAFEAAYAALDLSPHDTLTACRRMFEAAEIVVKTYFPAATILAANEVSKYVMPEVVGRFDHDKQAGYAAKQQVEALKGWVNSLQGYRHGQNTDEPISPPLALCVALLSAGASHIRFLVDTLSALDEPANPRPQG